MIKSINGMYQFQYQTASARLPIINKQRKVTLSPSSMEIELILWIQVALIVRSREGISACRHIELLIPVISIRAELVPIKEFKPENRWVWI